MAEIHPQLLQDCRRLGRFELCHLLLMLDANYPWCILVPDREAVTEVYELTEIDQRQLLHESSLLARAMATRFGADKMNIAALGNVVPQLHVHHIVRYRTDAAWPAPVWGKIARTTYTHAGLDEVVAVLRGALADEVVFDE
ncbi:MAG: HIT domain-containing protein [Gammaproteobacteria bacterium]